HGDFILSDIESLNADFDVKKMGPSGSPIPTNLSRRRDCFCVPYISFIPQAINVVMHANNRAGFFYQAEDGIRDIKRLLLSPGNTSISPENIAGQSLSVGFRPFPQTTPNRKRS
ncbi:hypothetical protein NLP37_24590, partial [Escherichia coli]|nr:hypothetical protein [Escherichia coli]